jgi:hypothetical protein
MSASDWRAQLRIDREAFFLKEALARAAKWHAAADRVQALYAFDKVPDEPGILDRLNPLWPGVRVGFALVRFRDEVPVEYGAGQEVILVSMSALHPIPTYLRITILDGYRVVYETRKETPDGT